MRECVHLNIVGGGVIELCSGESRKSAGEGSGPLGRAERSEQVRGQMTG